MKGIKQRSSSQDIDVRFADFVKLCVCDLEIAGESLVLQKRSQEMRMPADSITSIKLIQRNEMSIYLMDGTR